jgi:hypothetical protein
MRSLGILDILIVVGILLGCLLPIMIGGITVVVVVLNRKKPGPY